MNTQDIERALKLLEQATALLQDATTPNLEKSRKLLAESIRRLKNPG